MNKSESKYFNTARKMDEAFLSILQEKEFSYITVKEICEKAEVNRSTFYLHYNTIIDLLNEILAFLNDRFMEKFNLGQKEIQVENMSKEELVFINNEYLYPYLDFAKKNKNAYKAIHEQSTIFEVEKAYEKMFQHIFSPVLTKYDIPQDNQRYIMTFYRQGIVAIVMQWVNNDCKESVEEIAQIIKKCVKG